LPVSRRFRVRPDICDSFELSIPKFRRSLENVTHQPYPISFPA
jgi:hypothetical protein